MPNNFTEVTTSIMQATNSVTDAHIFRAGITLIVGFIVGIIVGFVCCKRFIPEDKQRWLMGLFVLFGGCVFAFIFHALFL